MSAAKNMVLLPKLEAGDVIRTQRGRVAVVVRTDGDGSQRGEVVVAYRTADGNVSGRLGRLKYSAPNRLFAERLGRIKLRFVGIWPDGSQKDLSMRSFSRLLWGRP